MDGKSKASGSLSDHWNFLAPKEIDDPEDKKPADWVDEGVAFLCLHRHFFFSTEKILDETDKKPEGYDDIPKQIADKNAKKVRWIS